MCDDRADMIDWRKILVAYAAGIFYSESCSMTLYMDDSGLTDEERDAFWNALEEARDEVVRLQGDPE